MRQKNINSVLVLFFLVSVTVFFLHSLYTKTSIFADAKFYYSYTRSLIFNRNLLLGDELYNLKVTKVLPVDLFAPNFYPPGTSIFWLPLFYLTFGATNLIQIFFRNYKFSGYETIFQYSCGVTNILLGIFALYLIYKMLSRHFTEKIALLSVVAFFLASNLFFYIAVEPINSHSVSFFISTLFVFYFFNYQKEKYHYLILGVIGGVAGLIRTQDLLLITIPVLQITIDKLKSNKKITTNCSLLTTGILLGFLPQVLLWKYFYNTFWYSPYFDVGFSFLKPQIFQVLFNTQNGLFITTPITMIAFVGIILMILQTFKKLRFGTLNLFRNSKFEIRNYLYAFFYFLLQLYLISSWNDTQGGSYSIRMMITTYPLLALGLANVINNALKKFGDGKTLTLIFLFSSFNFLSILNYLLKY